MLGALRIDTVARTQGTIGMTSPQCPETRRCGVAAIQRPRDDQGVEAFERAADTEPRSILVMAIP
jgi:hypothetical protein